MKIVHVSFDTGVYYPNGGYQENLLPKYQKELGNDVTIIASSVEIIANRRVISNKTKISFLPDGIKLIQIPLVSKSKLNFLHLHYFRSLYKYLASELPDLLFIHGISSLNYYCIPKYKRKHPEVVIFFDNHADSYNSMASWLSKYVLHGCLWRNLISRIDSSVNKYYGVTPGRCEFLHNIYGVERSKIDLLVMGADDKEMCYENKDNIRVKIRKEYSIQDDDFLVVTGGKIDEKKNIHILAHAISKSENKRVKLLIFGQISPSLRTEFKSLDKNRILFIGWIPSSEVYKYFYAADLVAFPGGHSVLWEQACASQVPGLFSKQRGFEHIDYGNCILLENNTATYYNSVINEVVSNTDLYKRLKENANGPKSKMFLYSEIAEKVIDDYLQIVKSKI